MAECTRAPRGPADADGGGGGDLRPYSATGGASDGARRGGDFFQGAPKHSRDPLSEMWTQLSLIDISRAYFNAKMEEDNPTCVALSAKHPRTARACVLSCASTCTAREGGRRLSKRVQRDTASLGFVQGFASPCMLHHPEKR